jgi:hypothetical protein
MTDDEFFGATEQLATIHRWARARYAAPWAVLFGVLLRVAASTGPHVQLPGIVGGRASLNLLCAFVAPSGGGKGISDKVSREAWPAQIPELPIGTGEGLAETYVDRRGKETADDDPIVNAIFNCPEIDVLTGIDARQGSTVLGTLKAFAMGELLGATNASKATTRIVQAHSYRGCLSVAAQPGHTGVILADSTGGTPQRFLWVLTIDPDMPDEQMLDPDPLDHRLPALLRPREEPGRPVEILYGPPEIRQTIVAAHLDRQRGKGDALDGHWMLTRCKVAATIAILHHRTVVSAQDWALSESVMRVSDRTRGWVVDQAKQAARAKMRERALFRAYGEETIDARHSKTARSRILRLLSTGPMSRSELRRAMGKQHYREAFDAVLPHLEKICQVITIPGEKALHYKLNPEFTGEPEFTPENPSSDGVNHEFTGEPDNNVTDMHNRRSHDSEPPSTTCAAWFANHIATLKSDGSDTTPAFAVYKAGSAQGYAMNTLRTTASMSGLVHIARREGQAVIWCLHPDTCDHPPARQASHWLRKWLIANSGPDGVSPSEAIAAGGLEPERYTRSAIVRAMQSMPDVESTGVGPASHWRITNTTEEPA